MSDTDTDNEFHKLSARLTSSGVEKLPVMSCAFSYRLNDIPTARIQVALGTAAGDSAAAVDMSALVQGRAAVTLELTQDDETIPVFRGYIGRPTYTRATAAAGMVYALDHWTSDFACSAKLSGRLSPRGRYESIMSDFNYTGFLGRADGNGMQSDANLAFSGDVVAWLTKVLKKLANHEGYIGFANETNDKTQGGHNYIARVCDKLKGSLTLANNATQSTLGTVIGDMLAFFSSPASGPTVWDTLLSFGNALQFSLVTTPVAEARDFLTLAAVNPMRTPKVSIEHSEYWSVGWNQPAGTRSLSVDQVVFFGPAQASDLTNTAADQTRSYIWGLWPNKPSGFSSRLVIPVTPMMLKLCSGAVQPPAAAARPSESNTQPPAPKTSNVINMELGNKFAQSQFYAERFGSRQLTITGKPRWDLTPGTQLKIGLPANFVSPEGKSGVKYLYGTLLGIDTVIDAAQETATSSLTVGMVHEEDERTDMTDEHPVYGA